MAKNKLLKYEVAAPPAGDNIGTANKNLGASYSFLPALRLLGALVFDLLILAVHANS
jgi:hypothetical protein